MTEAAVTETGATHAGTFTACTVTPTGLLLKAPVSGGTAAAHAACAPARHVEIRRSYNLGWTFFTFVFCLIVTRSVSVESE